MIKLAAMMVSVIMLLIFASQNMHETEIRFVFGPTVEMPMILIICGAFLCGYTIASILYMIRKTKRNMDEE